jgi:hypothetical protein
MRWLGLVVVQLLLTGCLTEQNAPEKLGAATCRREQECSQGDFEQSYDDLEDCVNTYVDTARDWQECAIAAGCIWNGEETDGCIEAIRSEDCADFESNDHESACDEVYDCTNEQLWDVGVCMFGG